MAYLDGGQLLEWSSNEITMVLFRRRAQLRINRCIARPDGFPTLSNSTSENSLSRLAGSADFSRDSDKRGWDGDQIVRRTFENWKAPLLSLPFEHSFPLEIVPPAYPINAPRFLVANGGKWFAIFRDVTRRNVSVAHCRTRCRRILIGLLSL